MTLPSTDIFLFAPRQVAEMIERGGVEKVRQPVLRTFVMAVEAGVFVAFGAMFFTVVMTGNEFGFGPSRLLGGVAFSLGMTLIVVAGAELFTGSTLTVLALFKGRVPPRALLGNWSLVYACNFMGARAMACLITAADGLALDDRRVAETAAAIVRAKVELPWDVAFLRGILCNMLVCLALWLSLAAQDVTARVVGVILPVSAFVALGFEHSIANMYLIPVAILDGAPGVTWGGLAHNLVPVTVGNVVGGVLIVAGSTWLTMRLPADTGTTETSGPTVLATEAEPATGAATAVRPVR